MGTQVQGSPRQIPPDLIKTIKIDRRTIPHGNYKEVGYESRQVIDIKISSITTEYRAQIL